jgi:pimeloyl-ACP methyl ester carboxylesterase
VVSFVSKKGVAMLLKKLVELLSATIGAILAALAIIGLAANIGGLVDNPWTVVANHAKRCGKLLAHTIITKAAGNRPVTLIGWSNGARVIFSALEYLNTVCRFMFLLFTT